MERYIDKKHRFVELFDKETGFYMRTGVIDNEGKDTWENIGVQKKFIK